MPQGEKGLLRLGGLGGVLSGVLGVVFIFVFPPGGGFVTEENLRLLLQNATRFVIGVILEFVGALLLIPLFLGLYRNLREAHIGYTLVGSVFGVLGATLSAISATQELSTLFLAQLYDQAATADKGAVVIAAQAASTIGGGFFLTSSVLMGLALLAIGGAMRRNAVYRRGYGWLSIASGIALVAGVVLVLSLLSPAGFLLFLPAGILWPVAVGLKVYRLSKVP